MSSDIALKAQSAEVVWHQGHIQRMDRTLLLGQHPITVWLTGLSASGKSTLAYTLEQRLIESGHAAYVLDGDNVRHGLNKDLGFSHQDRTENIRRIAQVAHLMNDAGMIVITAFISPYREDRELAKQIIGADQFVEVYVCTPLEACEDRDPKGMYKRAREGKIQGFTGVNAPYEPPTSPAMTIDTTTGTPTVCAEKLLAELMQRIAVSKSEMQTGKNQ